VKLVRIFGLLLGFAIAWPAGAQESVYSRAANLTLRLERPEDGQVIGSAVCVAKGRAATAAHVLREHSSFVAVFHNAERVKVKREKDLVDRTSDTALFEVAGCAAPEFASVEIGDEVFAVGHAPQLGRLSWYASYGRVGLTLGNFAIETNLTVVPGFSGSGLWTKDGKLAGICISKTELGARFVTIKTATS
jgi:S1-C subfamily serine protease